MNNNQKGFLIYVLEKEDGDASYQKLAQTCVNQLRQNFPKTPIAGVVWENHPLPDLSLDCVVPISRTLPDNQRSQHQMQWHNCYRAYANIHSPFDQTVMLDVDYWCVNNRIQWFFEVEMGAFKTSKFINTAPVHFRDKTFGESGVDIFWGTVLGWQTNEKNNDFWSKLQQNIQFWPAIAWQMNQPITPMRFDHLFTYTVLQENHWVKTAPFDLNHNNSQLELVAFHHTFSCWIQRQSPTYEFAFFNDIHLVHKTPQ
jgi:hypothetical protein